MSQVESVYDQYVSDLERNLPNVDPNFIHRVMYLERKLEDEYVKSPHVVLTIEYKQGVDMDKKLYDLREKFGLEAEYSDVHNILFAESRMDADKISQIAADQEIVKMKGKANPFIRS